MVRTIFIFGLTVVTASNAWPQAQIQAIVNSASFKTGVVVAVGLGSQETQVMQGLPSGGALATAFVSGVPEIGVNGAKITPGIYVASSPLPFQLSGMTVIVNGAFAPILSVYIQAVGGTQYAQIDFQMPVERNAVTLGSANCLSCPGPTNVNIAGAGASMTFPVGQRGMGGFFSDANGYAIARHASDNSLVTVANPAHAGETVIAYADDFFDVWPPPPMGLPVPAQPAFTYNAVLNNPAVLFFGGAAVMPTPGLTGGLYLQAYPATPESNMLSDAYGSFTSTSALQTTYEGLVVGLVGVEEIHFVVPRNQAPGNWALFFNTLSCGGGGGSGCTTGGPSVSSAYVTPR